MVKKADVPRHIIKTALALAASQGWRHTRLGDIAESAKLPLGELDFAALEVADGSRVCACGANQVCLIHLELDASVYNLLADSLLGRQVCGVRVHDKQVCQGTIGNCKRVASICPTCDIARITAG